jgi:outer membrane lipoprotein-sorting protein
MTHIPPSPAADEPVERAAAALRRASVPEGPPEETVTRTLAALRAADEAQTIPFPRKSLRQYAWKIAVAGALAAGVALYFAGLLPLRSPLAFAEVAAKLRDARTLTYNVTFKTPEQKEPERIKIFYKDPGWLRSEGAGQVSVSDLRQGKTLILDPEARTAMLIDFKTAAEAEKDAQKNALSLIDQLRKLADKKGESVGKKRIGEIETEGFRVEEEGFTLTLWANPKTKMPVLIELPIPVGDEEDFVILSDFQLDAKLDDALFRMETPEGYKLLKMELEEGKLEDDVVHLLRAYADQYEGKFPKSVSVASSDWQKYLKERWGDKKDKGLPETEAVQFVQKAIRVEKFLRKSKDHGYRPEGVKLGDRTKILFWYRPDNSDKYRAVFGDLHIDDVNANQLPETSRAKPSPSR